MFEGPENLKIAESAYRRRYETAGCIYPRVPTAAFEVLKPNDNFTRVLFSVFGGGPLRLRILVKRDDCVTQGRRRCLVPLEVRRPLM
jgi:hypothetical protein